MRTPASLIHSTAAATPAPTSQSSSPTSEATVTVDPDMVVILASLLCALICVVGLALVARCACRRAHSTNGPSTTTTGINSRPHLPRRGLKKKAIDALPVTAASGQGEGQEDQCAICLADFAAGEQLRVLPQCGHTFHIACVDTWLGAHASCPSCRAAIQDSSSPPPPPLPAPGRCRRCGATCVDDSAPAAARDESGFSP